MVDHICVSLKATLYSYCFMEKSHFFGTKLFVYITNDRSFFGGAPTVHCKYIITHGL